MSLVFDQYTERLRRKRKSHHTISAFRTAADRLDRWLRERGMSAETATFEALEDYFDQLELAPSSKGTHLRYIQAAYNYAIRRGSIRHNPAIDVEIETEPDREPRIITNVELRAIRDSIWRPRDWAFFHMLAYTGMRRSEVRALRWEDVDLREETIRVLGKGGKLRHVPIHPALAEQIAEACCDGFVVPSEGRHGVALETIQDMSRRLHPTYTPHDYRRTVATSLVRNGVEERLVDRILGWAPRTVRGRYYVNVASEELRRAILRLYADDPL